MADAHGSGPCDSNIMWVQVPSSALIFDRKTYEYISLNACIHKRYTHMFLCSIE